jgi:hypothetical protein
MEQDDKARKQDREELTKSILAAMASLSSDRCFSARIFTVRYGCTSVNRHRIKRCNDLSLGQKKTELTFEQSDIERDHSASLSSSEINHVFVAAIVLARRRIRACLHRCSSIGRAIGHGCRVNYHRGCSIS